MSDDRRVALVTGASGNVGRAVLRRLASQNWRLIAVGRNEDQLRQAVASLDNADDCLVLPNIDVTVPADCALAAAAGLGRFGRIDGVAHTVGGFAMGGFDEPGVDLFEKLFRLNVLSARNVFASVLPGMRKRKTGALVAVAAAAGVRGAAKLAAYSAAKAGVLRIVESLADETRQDHIRVNAVVPGTIDTPQNRASSSAADADAWTRPEDVAGAIALLLSDDASGLTGAAISVTARG